MALRDESAHLDAATAPERPAEAAVDCLRAEAHSSVVAADPAAGPRGGGALPGAPPSGDRSQGMARSWPFSLSSVGPCAQGGGRSRSSRGCGRLPLSPLEPTRSASALPSDACSAPACVLNAARRGVPARRPSDGLRQRARARSLPQGDALLLRLNATLSTVLILVPSAALRSHHTSRRRGAVFRPERPAFQACLRDTADFPRLAPGQITGFGHSNITSRTPVLYPPWAAHEPGRGGWSDIRIRSRDQAIAQVILKDRSRVTTEER